MPVVNCPSCKTYLRFQPWQQAASLLTLSCPACKLKLKVRSKKSAGLKILLAHEDRQISRQLFECLKQLGLSVLHCCDGVSVLTELEKGADCLLLLDVAFGGTFPFALIQQAKKRQENKQHKVLLLPTVYNKTAYMKKPTSLYGADAYLELHHIGDRLLPLVAELYPALRKTVTQIDAANTFATERSACSNDLLQQAHELAQQLVADVVFYHQNELQAGVDSGHAAVLLTGPLAEGRRLLRQRLPAVDSLKIDFVTQAFIESYGNFSETQKQTAEHAR